MRKIKTGDRVKSPRTGTEGTVGERAQMSPPVFEIKWDDGSTNYRQPAELENITPLPTFDKRREQDAPPPRTPGMSNEEYYDSDAFYNWERSAAGKRWMTPDDEITDEGEEEILRDDLEKGLFHPGAANALKRK